MYTVTLAGAGSSFSLQAAATFGFGPNPGRPGTGDDVMRLAFASDDLTHTAGAVVRQSPDGEVTASVHGDADADLATNQLRRILSLDQPDADWRAVGDRDPVIGRLQREYPGQRPVLFHSPYEAAAWSIISARRHRSQGQAARRRIAEALGTTYDLDGEPMAAFPSPTSLLEADELPGMDIQRTDRLRAVARAALDGQLDPTQILALNADDALTQLQTLPGIGPFYASLILLRSTGATDVFTDGVRHVAPLVEEFYGTRDVERVAEGWRPFRTWCMVLLRVAGARSGLTPEH